MFWHSSARLDSEHSAHLMRFTLIILFLFAIWQLCFCIPNILFFGNEEVSVSQIVDNSHWFLRQYDRFKRICRGRNNVIRARYDSVNGTHAPVTEDVRDWTLTSGSVHKLLNVPFDGKNVPEIEPCVKADDILSSFANFPATPKCKLSWFTPLSICKILHKFSFVLLEGDSFSRHFLQAFFAIIKDDWRSGGYPYYDDPVRYQNCSCDGQFSESLFCRKWRMSDFAHIDDFRRLGLCSDFDSHQFVGNDPFKGVHFRYGAQIELVRRQVSCEKLQYRPLFYSLQAAVHLKNDVKVGKDFLRKHFAPLENLKNCSDKIHVVYTGASVNSEELERKYPVQSRKRVANYNNAIREWLFQNYPRVHFHDPYNTSLASLNRSSDGLHFLADYHYMSVITILNLMNSL